MDTLLRQKLTAPLVGCTQEHLDLFVAAEIYTVADIKGLSETDLQDTFHVSKDQVPVTG